MDIITLFAAYLIPMILVGVAMEFIKGILFKITKMSGMVREYILVGCNFIVTAIIIIPFSLFRVDLTGIHSNVIDLPEYFKALLIVALMSGKVYDIFKKQFGGTNVNNSDNKKEF